jgi:hypothetical protein
VCDVILISVPTFRCCHYLRGSRVRFPAVGGNLSLHHGVQNGSGAHPSSYPIGTRGVKLYLQFPNTPSFKAQGPLYLYTHCTRLSSLTSECLHFCTVMFFISRVLFRECFSHPSIPWDNGFRMGGVDGGAGWCMIPQGRLLQSWLMDISALRRSYSRL